jgi:hypothetical protein
MNCVTLKTSKPNCLVSAITTEAVPIYGLILSHVGFEAVTAVIMNEIYLLRYNGIVTYLGRV